MIALWVVASWQRLKVLHETVIGSDSLGPYLQAHAALFGHLPRPPNPESGDALWVSMVPLVATTSSLSELFAVRFVLGALVAPMGFAAVFHWFSPSVAPKRRWAAGLTAGLFLAFDPGLLDTLVSGARSYGAPELMGATTLLVAMSLRQYTWAPAAALIAFVAAVGHHPLAAGMAMGGVLMLPSIHRAVGGRGVKWAFLIGLTACIPRILRVASIANCGEGIQACLDNVAKSNIVEPETWSTLVGKALHDRWLVDLDVGGWILLAGLVSLLMCPEKTHRKAAYWAIFGCIGILIIGVTNGYIRSYHLRITAVPFAVAAAMGLSRFWPVALLAASVFIGHTHALLPVGPDPGAVTRQDDVADRLPHYPLWVDRVWWNGIPYLDPSAVVLSGWLAGRRNFQLDGTPAFILLENHGQGNGWNIVEFTDQIAARQWLDAQAKVPLQRGGAYDWATIVNPKTKLEDARW